VTSVFKIGIFVQLKVPKKKTTCFVKITDKHDQENKTGQWVLFTKIQLS